MEGVYGLGPGPLAWPWALGPLGGPARIGRRDRFNQPNCFYGGSVGFGPMAWPWALGLLGGPARIGGRVRLNQQNCLYGGCVGFGPLALGMTLSPGSLMGPSKDRKES